MWRNSGRCCAGVPSVLAAAVKRQFCRDYKPQLVSGLARQRVVDLGTWTGGLRLYVGGGGMVDGVSWIVGGGWWIVHHIYLR